MVDRKRAFVKQISVTDWVTVQELNGYYIIFTTYLTDNDTVGERKATYYKPNAVINALVKAGENAELVASKLAELEQIRLGRQC